MATRYSQSSGTWNTATRWNTAANGSGSSGVPVDGDTVVIQAAHDILFDVDLSSWVTGIAGLTITSHATTPGQLYFDGTVSAGTYTLPIKTGTTIVGTNAAVLGKLYIGSSGTPLPLTHKFIISFLGTANIASTPYLDIRLYCTPPSIRLDNGGTDTTTLEYVKLSGINRTFTVDYTTDVFTCTGHNYANTQTVRLSSTGTLPAVGGVPLLNMTTYFVRDVSGSTFKLALTSGGTALNLSDNGTGTHTIYKYGEIAGATTLDIDRDVTTDSNWSTTSNISICNVNKAAQAESRTLSALSSNSMTITSGLTAAKLPNTYIVLCNRNIELITGGNVTLLTSANTGTVLNCSFRQTGSVQGTVTTYGTFQSTGCVISGFANGFNQPSQLLTSGVVITGCTTAIGYIIGASGSILKGLISGCTTAIYGVYGEMEIASRIVGCGTGIQNWYSTTRFYPMLVSGYIYGCGTALAAGTFTLTGTIDYCSNGTVNMTAGTIAGTIKNCDVGSFGPSMIKLSRAIYTSNTVDLSYPQILYGYGASLDSNSQVDYYKLATSDVSRGIFLYDLASAGTPSLGYIKGWTNAGTIITVTGASIPSNPPSSLSYCYKSIPEVNSYPLYFDFPIFFKANKLTSIEVYIKCDTLPASLTEGPRVQIIDPNYSFNHASSLLVDTAAANSTSWQTVVVSYTPTVDRSLILRVRGRDATAANCWYWMYKIRENYINTVGGRINRRG